MCRSRRDARVRGCLSASVLVFLLIAIDGAAAEQHAAAGADQVQHNQLDITTANTLSGAPYVFQRGTGFHAPVRYVTVTRPVADIALQPTASSTDAASNSATQAGLSSQTVVVQQGQQQQQQQPWPLQVQQGLSATASEPAVSRPAVSESVGSGVVSKAGPRQPGASTAAAAAQGQTGTPSAGATSSSDSDGWPQDDDLADLAPPQQQMGSNPLPPGGLSWQGQQGQQQQQQQQQPRQQQGRPGRTWAQKVPFSQCANTTLTYDVSFIGSVKYAQVGTVRFGYHRFGPLGGGDEAGPRQPSMASPKAAPSPVLMISGWGTSMYIWPIPLLKALAASRPVIIFDNMRTGSSNDTGRAKMTIPLMADATAGFIQSIGLVKPALWSWSLGASIGYALLAKHSNKVGNVILSSGTPGGPNALMPPDNVWRKARALDQNYVALLPFLFPDGAQDDGVCNFFAAFNSFSSAGFLSSPLGAQALKEQGAAMIEFFQDSSVVNRLKDVSNRVLIVHGVQDKLVPVRNAVLGAQHLLGSWMMQLPTEGHAVPFDNLPAVIEVTLDFFSFASPLSAAELRMWSSFGETYAQQSRQRGGGIQQERGR